MRQSACEGGRFLILFWIARQRLEGRTPTLHGETARHCLAQWRGDPMPLKMSLKSCDQQRFRWGQAIMTKTFMAVMVFVSTIGAIVAIPTAEAAPCLIVTLTGTQSGLAAVNGLAGAGTLVRYGDDSDNCSAVKLQFDAGRGTNMRLSQVGVPPGQLNAVFFTHMHSDHTEGFADIMQLRWHFNSKGPKLDAVCSSDVISPLGFTISCKKFAMHIGDAFLQSGEIAQRNAEDKERFIGGPAELINVVTFEAKNEPQVIWSSGDVKVSAIRSTHIPGHASYRVDT